MAYVAASSGVKIKIVTRLRESPNVVSKVWPETDLSVVNAVTQGGIYIDGNTIGFNPDTQNLVSSGGMTNWVGSHYCPLEKTIPGGTQYADMFVRGGTATVTPVPGNVGYGTLDNSWNVSTHIPAPPFDEHTSRSLPTVPAVASAIDEAIYGMTTGISGAYVKKTDYATTASHGIVVVPSDHGLSINGGTLSMNVAQVVGNYTDAATLVTAGNAGGVVVMNAITGATTWQENLAVTPTVDAVYDAIETKASYLTTWALGTFVTKGSIQPVDIGYATYTSAGKAQIQLNGGITITGDGILSLTPATTSQIGGVVVKTNGGIDVDAGTIYITAATVYNDINGATAGTDYGGVRVIKTITEPSDDLRGKAIVPNNEAVWNAAYGYDADFTCTKNTAGTTITCGSGRVYINGTATLYTITTVTGSVTKPSSGSTDIWLNITKAGTEANPTFSAAISTSRSTTAGTQAVLLAKYDSNGIPTRCHKGPVVWIEGTSSGGGTGYFGDFKVSCAGHNSTVVVDPGDVWIDGGTAAITGATVACTVKGSTTAVKKLWLNIPNSFTGLTATESPSMSNTVYSVPLAYVIGSTVCQYQHGPVVIRGRWS